MRRDDHILRGDVTSTPDAKYHGPSRATLRKTAGKRNVWVCGDMYMCTKCDMKTVTVGTVIVWKWATSSVLTRPAPDTELLMVNEKDGRSVMVRVDSASCGLINGDNIKATRRASGTMSSVAISTVKDMRDRRDHSRKGGKAVGTGSVFSSKQQADTFIAV